MSLKFVNSEKTTHGGITFLDPLVGLPFTVFHGDTWRLLAWLECIVFDLRDASAVFLSTIQ